ncbi:MAG: hypothetical protein RRB22_08665 [Gammaproteobacteria bacterium]|nr:hypothetical protein [Gammaproteobacteria bacterium]
MRVNGPDFHRISIIGIFSAAVLFLLSSCGGEPAGSGFATGEGSSFSLSCSSPFAGPDCVPTVGGTTRVIPLCNSDQTGIVDGCGVAITTPIDLHDPITLSLTGLTANTRHTITIADTDTVPLEITPTGGLIAISDSTGAINKATVVQNMLPGAFLGDYTVTVAEEGGGGTPQTLTYNVADLSRVQCVDTGGVAKASFLSGDNVFARVDKNTGSLADGSYDVYVLSDVQKPLANGGLISGTPATITVTGGTGQIDLGLASTYGIGGYDVVVDVNGNGYFNPGTDLISRHSRLLPCFAVQGPSAGAVQKIASDKNGNKREIFDPNADVAAIRDLQAFLMPTERSALTTAGAVDTYLVAHQAVWANGDPLVAVGSGAKRSPVQNDNNSLAPWVLVPFASLASLGGTTCYDVVVDTDRDGLFDVGTDFVDNINHLGITSCGVRISTASCTNVSIAATAADASNLADGATTTDTAISIAGTILGTPTAAYLTVTAGEQSNTIALALGAGGSYALDLPLFAGANHITVSGIYADNSSCSQTISITSLTDLALFRAQMTWDGSTDMDLHLVRPGGSYSNGGGGADDCNWGNCKVGLDGTGINNISWGTGDEEDDPKLDVDCISCGNGIENIWMNQITQDGEYKVYVDAYSGTENDVTVTISILGTEVGQVNCGDMDTDTATDSCFVGTITWAGGTAGIGSFTPAGTKAADF